MIGLPLLRVPMPTPAPRPPRRSSRLANDPSELVPALPLIFRRRAASQSTVAQAPTALEQEREEEIENLDLVSDGTLTPLSQLGKLWYFSHLFHVVTHVYLQQMTAAPLRPTRSSQMSPP